MAFVKDITQQEFGQEVLQRSNEVPVVVDFWATWCGPCKTLGPMLEKAAADYEGRFELVKVDVDQNQALAQQFGIQSIPTVVAFKDGNPVSQFMGAVPEAQLREFLDALMPTELDLKVEQARDLALEGDEEAASALYSEVLEQQPDHPDAGTGLASLLIAGDTETALIILGRLPRTTEVEKLEAAARMTAAQGIDLTDLEQRVAADPADGEARIELGIALAAKGEHEAGLDHLLDVVRAKDEHLEAARDAMIDVFGVLGSEHALTQTYRKALANVLF